MFYYNKLDKGEQYMNYQEFLEYIRENLPEVMNARILEQRKKLESSDDMEAEVCYVANIHQITKNNGIVLDGVTLLNKGEHMAPNVYLNSYYESYQMGKPLNVIMEEIILCYEKAKNETVLDVMDLCDFTKIKERIVLRLVNYDKNKEQLENCPHKKILDLAITFRFLANMDEFGLASSLIGNKEFELWDIEFDELYQIAMFNTMREFPWKMDSLVKVVAECFGDHLPEHLRDEFQKDMHNVENVENRVNMYVLTNSVGLNGATSILYDNVIKNFSNIHNANVFILPSSVHEVMLVPENDETDPQFLQDLVCEANQSAVGLIDLLSDNIYYYDREQEQLFLYDNVIV